MGGGGKSQTSTSSVSIPPEVLARYNSVNAQAQTAAATPFQPYSGEFVAPINATQQAGIGATSAAAGAAQPYYGAATQQLGQAQQQGQGFLGAATGAAMAGAQPIMPGGLDTSQYMNPYTQSVVNATQAALGQQFGQQNAAQQAQAIQAGAFGGERAGLQRAQLAGQQGLTAAQAISPLYQANYQQALQTAQQQQGVGLGAAQANRQALQGLGTTLAGLGQQGYTQGSQTAQQLAGLGTGAQTAALQGAQAQIGAGTLAQQTQQAGDTAQYQQYLQQQGYPFQVAQFLANIAEGTGALSGSTTTSTQPSSFFSDERLKYDKKQIGKTKSGLPIYSFKYKGDDKTQVGLMAQDVEKVHPEAVGESQGYKTVDYEKALRPVKKAYGGGIDPNSMGGVVSEPGAFARGGYIAGGAVDPNDISAILAQQQKSFGPFAQQGLAAGMPGGAGGAGVVPQQQMHVPKLITAGAMPKAPETGFDQIKQGYGSLDQLASSMTGTSLSKRAGNQLFGTNAQPGQAATDTTAAVPGQAAQPGLIQEGWDKLKGAFSSDMPQPQARGGGVMPHHYADGGDVEPYDLNSPSKGYVDPSVKEGDAEKDRSLATAGKTPGVGPSGASQVASGLGLANTAMNVAENVPEFLAMFGLSTGGIVPREHHANGDRVGKDISLPISEDVVNQQGGLGAALPADDGSDTGIPPAAQGLMPVQPDSSQPDYRPVVVNAAKANGIDPDHALRLVKGESGFKPESGDEGSSGSIWQLHVGNLSEKYPHAGLGDEYFKQRQPDLAEKLSPAQKIAFLNDPANQSDVSDFAADHISKNGAGAWTQAHVQGLFGLPAAGRTQTSTAQPNAQPGGIQPTSTSGETSQPGFFDRNKNIILPVLQGLGAMAGSKSRYLGSAVLEGLGAGAKAYGDVAAQQAGTEQTQAQTTGISTENMRKSLQYVQGLGAVAWVYDPVTKRVIPMNAADARARAMRGENIQFVNAPNASQNAPAQAPGSPSTAVPGVTQPAPAAPPSLIPSSVSYSPDTRATAQNDVAGSSGNYEGDISFANNLLNTVQGSAQNARDNGQYLNTLGDQLVTANRSKGLNAPGAGFSERANVINFLNTTARAIGAPINFGDADVGQGLVDKINTLQGAARANSGSQHSYSALDTFKTASPNLDQAPGAAAEILAQLKVDQQMALDREKHALQYKNDAPSGGMRQEPIRFSQDNPQSDYTMQREQIKQMILSSLDPANKGKPSAFQLLSSGQIPIDQAQKELKQLGYDPRLVKYFYSQAH